MAATVRSRRPPPRRGRSTCRSWSGRCARRGTLVQRRCCSVLVGVHGARRMVPLFSVLYMLLVRGGGKLLERWLSLFTELPPAAGMDGRRHRQRPARHAASWSASPR